MILQRRYVAWSRLGFSRTRSVHDALAPERISERQRSDAMNENSETLGVTYYLGGASSSIGSDWREVTSGLRVPPTVSGLAMAYLVNQVNISGPSGFPNVYVDDYRLRAFP